MNIYSIKDTDFLTSPHQRLKKTNMFLIKEDSFPHSTLGKSQIVKLLKILK
jgi:hypothetical protein